MTGARAAGDELVLVTGSARCDPSKRDTFVRIANAMVDSAQHDDGCLFYRMDCSLNDPNVFVSTEIWERQSSLDAHMEHEHTIRFVATLNELLLQPPELTTRLLP